MEIKNVDENVKNTDSYNSVSNNFGIQLSQEVQSFFEKAKHDTLVSHKSSDADPSRVTAGTETFSAKLVDGEYVLTDKIKSPDNSEIIREIARARTSQDGSTSTKELDYFAKNDKGQNIQRTIDQESSPIEDGAKLITTNVYEGPTVDHFHPTEQRETLRSHSVVARDGSQKSFGQTTFHYDEAGKLDGEVIVKQGKDGTETTRFEGEHLREKSVEKTFADSTAKEPHTENSSYEYGEDGSRSLREISQNKGVTVVSELTRAQNADGWTLVEQSKNGRVIYPQN